MRSAASRSPRACSRSWRKGSPPRAFDQAAHGLDGGPELDQGVAVAALGGIGAAQPVGHGAAQVEQLGSQPAIFIGQQGKGIQAIVQDVDCLARAAGPQQQPGQGVAAHRQLRPLVGQALAADQGRAQGDRLGQGLTRLFNRPAGLVGRRHRLFQIGLQAGRHQGRRGAQIGDRPANLEHRFGNLLGPPGDQPHLDAHHGDDRPQTGMTGQTGKLSQTIQGVGGDLAAPAGHQTIHLLAQGGHERGQGIAAGDSFKLRGLGFKRGKTLGFVGGHGSRHGGSRS